VTHKKNAGKPGKKANKKAKSPKLAGEYSGKLRNATETAELLGISRQWLATLAKRGVLPRATGSSYPWPEVREAYNQYLESKGEQHDVPNELKLERAHLIKVRRELAELDLAEKRGELVPIQVTVDEFSRACLELRAQLLLIPSKWAPQLANRSKREVERELRKAVDDALDALSQGRDIPDLGSGKKPKS